MSKNSSKQTVQASMEWLAWAKQVYPSLKNRKKKSAPPIWSLYDER
tara:strand:- start:134 stop:271 length:138 start_codon:yes stop_codon:yes gene_type:complete